jgi:NAD(P)-dependent dehydrogenase (short-subunit alcohol dehydrogenase family)
LDVAMKLADTGIKVTSVCPGFVQTDLTPVGLP